MAVNMSDLTGTWDMVHDDWRGTLVINPSDQILNGVEGNCQYRSYVIDGTWTGGDGVKRGVRGHFQGKDLKRRTSETCKWSDHLVTFQINFGADNPRQPFEGYVFSRAKRTMSGYTWWAGMPFSWYATKR